ncbi:zinc-binding dehydrogenase [Bradyrhizobium sp. NBAIM01]|uniref:zinc-binding dehydrogenase n=1 Tax=Bradyrhizobium sp. NBAIM01 TaxID=2793818 RepID=UPI001CD78BE6|nr:zinc-binding dehydrogenase [Bradyrhizobium sp. NBAIM01]MCA1510417.1 zinc-binding dehydrogenase [Bradyrhizobium sp. NBAIM01]
MALHRGLLREGFKLPTCEKHFHDYDETWLILSGRGTGYWIDHDGFREEFTLEAGDVWMIPAGFEHGSEGFADTKSNSEDFRIQVFNGTLAAGHHVLGHHYVEQSGYIPRLTLTKTPTDRYKQKLRSNRGVTFVEKGKAKFGAVDCPPLREGEILCRTVVSGLTNGTERNSLLGGNYGGAFPRRAGYQRVAEIVELGGGVARRIYKTGDLIFSGRSSGIGHVEYFTCNVANPNDEDMLLVKLAKDGSIDPIAASLFGIASVALHDIRRADVRLGEELLVIGAGPVGQLVAQVGRAAGARTTLVDLDEARLKLGLSLGPLTVFQPTPAETLVDHFGRDRFDVIMETSGAPVLDAVLGTDWAGGLLKPKGRLALIGGRGEVGYTFNAGQAREIEVLHASHFVQSDLEEVSRLASLGILKTRELITKVVPISECEAVYAELVEAPSNLLGVAFDWRCA